MHDVIYTTTLLQRLKAWRIESVQMLKASHNYLEICSDHTGGCSERDAESLVMCQQSLMVRTEEFCRDRHGSHSVTTEYDPICNYFCTLIGH
jgi:hypothetical protein